MRYYIRFAVVLPLVVMALSFAIQHLLPGCTVDEGAGASSGCGVFGPLLSISRFGGFIWLLFGIIGLFPISLITARWKANDATTGTNNSILRALEREAQKKDINSSGGEHGSER
jgi:hypothetical protein